MSYTDILLDFETYCDLSLKDVGVEKYTRHESFRPLCLSFVEFNPDTLARGPVYRWIPGWECNFDFSRITSFWAFNAGFDFRANLASVKRNLLPFKLSTDINDWKDIQVVLAKFALPQNLEDAADVLQTPIKKRADGPLIIKRCCKKNVNPPTPEDLEKLYQYCDQDIEASFELLKACPSIKITDSEWKLWRITFMMNHKGLPIDYEAVKAIKERVDSYKEVICETLPDITNGAVTKPTQTQRIKKFLNDNGVPVKDTTVDTLEALIEKDDRAIERNALGGDESTLPAACRQLVEARLAGGSSSVAKFNKLLDMQVDDRVHDFIRYGGTSTIRWAGAGYQVHSLPKATVADPENLISRFKNFGEIENPIISAKALCRSVITAPTGEQIYAGDYSSIEYLLLIWLADMRDKIQMFKEGKSAYIDMAAYLFGKPYEAIDKHAIDNLEYFLGKQAILGCGYQMGATKFNVTCARYGVTISMAQAKFAVDGYRRMHYPIVQLWDNVHRCCIAAIQNPGKVFNTNKCSFYTAKDRGVTWLIIKLPSKTKQFYHSPELSKGKYGYEIKHMGLEKFKWVRKFLSPGRITENIIQRLARELMANGILEVNKLSSLFSILFQVHDELVSLGPDNEENDSTLKTYLKALATTPDWGKDIPLKAGGYFGKRYKKD